MIRIQNFAYIIIKLRNSVGTKFQKFVFKNENLDMKELMLRIM